MPQPAWRTNLKELRKKIGVTQGQLAFALDKSQQIIANWEKNMGEPNIEELIKITRYFGITFEEFVADAPLIEKENTSLSGKNAHLNAYPNAPLNAKKGAKTPAEEDNLGNIAADEGLDYATLAAVVNAAITGALRPINARLEGLERAVFKK